METHRFLNQGNHAFRERNYEEALFCYQRALRRAPAVLKSSLEFNLDLTKRRLRAQHGEAAQSVIDRIQEQLRLEDEINTVSPHFDRDAYLARNPDVAQAGIDPVLHYCSTGWREGRDPHAEFSTRFYLETHPDVQAAAVNPYWHYLVAGKNEGRTSRAGAAPIQPQVLPRPSLEKPDCLDDFFFNLIRDSSLFDPAWYMAQYGEKHRVTGNALGHYITHGAALLTNPSTEFDTEYYLKANPDVAESGFHPFLHFICSGKSEGRLPKSQLDGYAVEKAIYVPRLSVDAPAFEKAARVIAFYLPQFHPIPENNQWWGEGFTEWTNVRPAKPSFDGHYQPHIPDDYLGYYDLRDPSTMRKQIELAKQYGIEGFCFYVYWFAGKRLLETPVDNYLADSNLDLPFCICWANENWSRRWDGSEHEILMAQDYSDLHDLEFIADMAKYLRDPRYIRVDGCPLLIVYRPNLFPDMVKTVGRWRQWCRANEIGEIYVAYVQSFDDSAPDKYGMDAAIEFPPSGWYAKPESIHDTDVVPEFNGRLLDWRYLVKRSESYATTAQWVWRGVCPSWDNTARRKGAATVFHRSSPALFKRWLTNAFSDTFERVPHPDKRLVFVNAWNEWAEGAHLEPDREYGYAWLQSVRDSHIEVMRRVQSVLIISHDALPHGAQYLILEVGRTLRQLGFFVATMLLDGGRLTEDFRAVSNAVINVKDAPEGDVAEFLSGLRSNGCIDAITSTVVCGGVLSLLKAHGFRVLSLIHEMKDTIRSMGQEQNAAMVARLASRVVFPAKIVADQFMGIEPLEESKIVIRPQGLLRKNPYKNRRAEAKRLICDKHGLSHECQIVLCVGYVDHRKGADLFVETAGRVLRKLPNTVFIWVGHAERVMKDLVDARIADHGLKSSIIFVGFDKEPMAYYAAASAFALTSREDPFPNVVLESAEVGVPVVAFDGASGAGDFIVEQGGRLAPYLDIEAYGEALCALLTLPAQGERSPVGTLHRYVSDLIHHLNGRQRVSVVVPNYNYERHIRARLDSVCNQTHAIYELIVLDDRSSDDSVAVMTDYLDGLSCDRRLVVNERNSGSVFRQWRRGLDLSGGDLVWIAEADDLSDPAMLEALVPAFDDPEVVLAYCQSQQIDEHGAVLADDYLDYTVDISSRWASDHVVDGLEEIRHALSIKNTIPNVSAVVFRRTALLAAMDAIGECLFDYRVAGDWLVYLHVLRQGKAYFCSRALNKHRRHTVSVTKSTAVRSHLREVLEMQQTACAMANPPADVVAKAQAYADKLTRQFGLH